MIGSLFHKLTARALDVQEHRYAQIPLLLISGVGRSGTTALRTSLGAHREVHYTGRENNIIHDVVSAAQLNCTRPSRKYAMLVDQQTYNRQFQNLLLNLLFPNVRRVPPRRIAAFSAMRAHWADYLCEVFPQVKIVFIVRNGIEVVSSRLMHEGFRHDPFGRHCVAWRSSQEVTEWGRGREDFFLVRHEELISADVAESIMRSVCTWAGLSFDSRCMQILSKKRFHPTTFPGEGKDSFSDLERRRERWQMWTEGQRGTFVRECRGAMEYFGYEIPWLRESNAAA